MQVSIIIPVWKGAAVIVECLDAVIAHSGERLLEIICVDNASPDDAATIITQRYPQARLISQPINLGFAGGVNAGLRAARGDVGVLLNQDCIVQAGWLDALLDALNTHPEFGIAGCTIFNADGSINHAGAQLRKPIALGQHLTDRNGDQPRAVEYVTGAAMAIRRSTWEAIGPFDDGFYPAYYEEVDYCYRARQHGLEIGYVPAATVQHLFSSREWQRDPLKSWATHQHSRYRFVCKHFDTDQLTHFFELEAIEIEAESSYEMNAARVLGSRDTLRNLAEIAQRRVTDLADPLTVDQVRLLRVGFAQITRLAFAAIERQARANDYMPPRWLETAPVQFEAAQRPALYDQLRELDQREQTILTQAFFTADSAAPIRVGKRLLSLMTGREHRLLTELNVLHTQRLAVLEQLLSAQHDQARAQHDQTAHALNQIRQQFDRRLALLETLMDYDYQ
jgi:GT2 family glycosyltransferase